MQFADVMTADRGHDAEIRRLLRDLPSGGMIQLCNQKEPSYFDAFEVEGQNGDVGVGRIRGTGQLAGIFTRSEKRCFVNGATAPRWMGYLSNLRILPAYRRSTGLFRGYRKLRELHGAGNTQLYLSTIMDDNAEAKKILTSGRAGLPTYRDLGLYRTYVFGARRNPWRPRGGSRKLSVRRGCDADVASIAEFLAREGRKRQFFPAYTEADLRNPSGLLRGLAPGDIYLCEDETGICATTATWDQASFRQWYIHGYAGGMGAMRYPYNVFAWLTGRPVLPRAGKMIDYRFLALVCIRDDRLDAAEALWHAAFKDLAAANKQSQVLIGLHEHDPLAALCNGKRSFELKSRLYVVHWEDGAAACDALDDRVPYLELGSL